MSLLTDEKTAHMWLATKLAEEYILIDISLINSRRQNKSHQKNLSSALKFLSAAV
jgi:hypothetical protein